ncbi:MAG: DUF3368 domain-containing protein [Alphaproteobacteria bacterium]|nr:DUF3368 domain-containing protein [Alphaproteobacteria bacterium]
MRLIVTDAGPLIAFARSGLLELLQQMAGDLLVPATVYSECTREALKPGAKAVIEARRAKRLKVRNDAETTAKFAGKFANLPSLGAGEIAALAMALDLECPVLMDERLGRNVARLHKIQVIGSAGVLLAAKERRLIAEIAPILAAWRNWRYFLSPSLLAAILQRAGELPGDSSS